jgi:hypothetical protein
LNRDYITNSNLDIKDRNEKDYSLEKTYYDPLFDNILSNESYGLINNIISNVNKNKSVVSEYLNILMEVILIPFLFNIINNQNVQPRSIFKLSKIQSGGNSKKNRRTKKKTSKTNKKYTRKVHPKKHRKTKRKSKK